MTLTAAQIEHRRSGLGASDIPAVAGLVHYLGALTPRKQPKRQDLIRVALFREPGGCGAILGKAQCAERDVSTH